MDFDYLKYNVSEGIATVRLSRPPVNAVNQAMYREIRQLFEHVEIFGSDLKAIVLTGSGKHFCAGNDLAEFATLSPDNADDRMAEVRAAFFAIQDCPVPVIGALHGTVVGTGLAIAASCDFVVAADNVKMGTPEVRVGIMGGARHLARLVPEPMVRWMYFTAELVSATKLAEIGAVIEVVAPDDLLETAYRHARLVSRHSAVVLRMAKRSLNAIESMDLQPGYKFEQGLTREICGEPDSREAVRATLEQRSPRYPSEIAQ